MPHLEKIPFRPHCAMFAFLTMLTALPAATAEPQNDPAEGFWALHRADHPACRSWVDRHEALTRTLEAEAEKLRTVTDKGGRKQVTTRLNALSQERSQTLAGLQDCIKDTYGYDRVFTLNAEHNMGGLPAMTGETEFAGAPFKVDLAPGHLIGDAVEGTIKDHPTYEYAWGRIDSDTAFRVKMVRDYDGALEDVNFVVPIHQSYGQ